MKTGRRRIYEDETKVLYEGADAGTLIQYFKDEVRATGAGRASIVHVEGKGTLSNRISACLMEHLAAAGIANHFVRRLNMREQIVRNAERLPFSLRVHNYATGSFARNFKLEEGASLPRAIVEYNFREETGREVAISDEHITAFAWASTWEMDEIFHLALRANDFLQGFCLGVGLRLSRVDLSFARLWEEEHTTLLLADEITPDTCRLWDLRGGRPLFSQATFSGVGENAGKVVGLADRVHDNAGADNGAGAEREKGETSAAHLYQHFYREVAERFGVFTDIAHPQASTGIANGASKAELDSRPPTKGAGESGAESAGAHSRSKEQGGEQEGKQGGEQGSERGVVLPMRRDLRRLSPRLRRSRKGDESAPEPPEPQA